MYGINEKCICPICNAEYDTNPQACSCGFEGLTYIPFYMNDEMKEKYADREKEQLFRIFKFAKQVYLGEKPYEKSETVLFPREEYVDVDEALERRGLAYVEVDKSETDGKPTVACEGLLAMRSNIHAIILNVNCARAEMLDECSARILIIGSELQKFTDGGFIQYRGLRYIWADSKNQYFTADDNVLFNKDKTRLVAYALARPGKEYIVPPTVKYLEPYSFYRATNLEKLYLPRGIRMSDKAIMPNNVYHYVDGELVRSTPSFTVVYYDPKNMPK